MSVHRFHGLCLSLLIAFAASSAFGSSEGETGIVYAKSCKEALQYAKASSADKSCGIDHSCGGYQQHNPKCHVYADMHNNQRFQIRSGHPTQMETWCVGKNQAYVNHNVMECTKVSKNLVNHWGTLESK